MKVLLIEDDRTLNQNISEALQAESSVVTAVYDGFLAEKILRKEQFDCIILDISLPGKNGFEICKTFREYNSSTPVIMLTAFSELDDKVQGFNCGADDYLTKPFYMRELLLRIHALTKRTGTNEEHKALISADDITITPHNKKVTRQGQEIPLTPREFQILMKLVSKKGELVSKKELIKEIWGTHLDVNTNTIEVYINFLRNKIDKPFGKQNIKTKTGYGYYFE
ncbi:MAG: response regulator transcription factor [Terrimonas sp.]|nr:response regulator transcription factor [Terrimonas sp.]OJY93249.1 MAG: DNA-binding response regulator [Sphingobacteriales bacterium 40-81]